MVPRLPGHVDEDFEVKCSESGIFGFFKNQFYFSRKKMEQDNKIVDLEKDPETDEYKPKE